MKSLVILGRQPKLGLAELESLYGAKAVTPFGGQFALLDAHAEAVRFERLGGVIKLARVVDTIKTTNWFEIEDYLLQRAPKDIEEVPEGKMTVGLSAYGLDVTPKQITRTSLELKKVIKQSGHPVRIVPNKSVTLSTPQVLHNNLCSERGWELVLVRKGNETILAQTAAEQDIESYTLRDRGRPKRDAYVGMLPPKLAQIIINLATADIKIEGTRLLDPFCGTGVLLQEALLMGYDVIGTDLEPRMIDYTITNLTWLRTKFESANSYARIEVGDAQTTTWPGPIDVIAAETYLGEPISQIPNHEKLTRLLAGTDALHTKMLQNIGAQITTGTRLCLAVPAWRTKNGWKHLPTLDHLSDLGYNRMVFEHAKNDDLIYAREDQLVARELVVLIKK
jgi:tRNA (guanine10-N2)-dimethyltransferase